MLDKIGRFFKRLLQLKAQKRELHISVHHCCYRLKADSHFPLTVVVYGGRTMAQNWRMN